MAKARKPTKWLKKRMGKLSKKQIAAIVGIIVIGAAAISFGVYYGTMRRPAPAAKLSKLEVSAKPYFANAAFPSDKTVSVTVYNSDKEQVRSVTLTGPSWKETLTGLGIKGSFYVQSTSSDWYWVRDASSGTDVQMGDGSWARKVNVTQSEMSFVSQFAATSSIDWFYGENETGLAGGGSSSFTLTEKYTMRNYSAFKGYQLWFQVNNSSAVNISSVDFGGETYSGDDLGAMSNNKTMLNVSDLTATGWTYHVNSGDEVNESITISGTEDIAVNETIALKAWGRYVQPGLYEDSWATTATQTVYLS